MATGKDTAVSPADGRRGRASRDARPQALVPVTGRAPLSAVQAVAGVWLIASPFVLTGPHLFVAVKDVVIGAVLVAVTFGALVNRDVRAVESRVCVVLGALLITASIVLEFGSGSAAAARQWNEVVVGVLLVYLSATRLR